MIVGEEEFGDFDADTCPSHAVRFQGVVFALFLKKNKKKNFSFFFFN